MKDMVEHQPDTGNVEGGNKSIFGTTGEISSKSREHAINEKSKMISYPSAEVLVLENFEHYGDRPAGTQQQVNDMVSLTGKEVQESYRSGLSMSAEYTQKVTDR